MGGAVAQFEKDLPVMRGSLQGDNVVLNQRDEGTKGRRD